MMTTTNAAAETTTLHVDGETLSVALVALGEAAGVRTHAIEVSHPEGGEVSFEVVEFRGFQISSSEGYCPSCVAEAVRGIVRRMDAAWASAQTSDRMDARKAFGRAMGL